MKKRILPLFLALALCFGLSVPAFAAEGDDHPLPSARFVLPDGFTAEEQTETFQVRALARETVEETREASGTPFTYTYDIYSYSEAAAQEFTATPLPLGAIIRVKDPYGADIDVSAWSDPDGDGVYDQRIFSWEINTAGSCNAYSLLPLGDGPYNEAEMSLDGYSTSADALYAGFSQEGIANDPLVSTTDILYRLYGPNTILKLTAAPYGGEAAEIACFRLTGEIAPPAIAMNVFNPDNDIPPMDNVEFTLRNVKEEFFDNNRLSAIHTDFTREKEPVTVELDNLPILDPRGVVQIRGIQTVSDGQKPWERVNLRAWSDPDGDGVYDQQLFTYYYSTQPTQDSITVQNSITLVPLSNPGPFSFREIDYNGGGAIYSRSVNIIDTDELTSLPYSSPYITKETPSSLILTGNYLTWLFGPNTLVQIQGATAGEYQDGALVRTESPAFYCYIPKDAAATPVFNDVPAWFYDAVNWAAENGVTTGTSYHKFSPEKDCTQAQILTFLYRAAQEPPTDAPCPVTLPASLSYAESALAWAAEKGMIDASLDPKAPCTRAQAVSYIWQALDGSEVEGGGSFTDVSADADYAAAVAWAVENGVTNGFDNGDGTFQFRPGKVCSRGEIAAFLHRAYVPEARLTASP